MSNNRNQLFWVIENKKLKWNFFFLVTYSYFGCCMFLCSVDGQQQTEPGSYPMPSSFYIPLLAAWCQPKSLEGEEFCKQEPKRDRRTIPYLLGYAPSFYTSTIHVLSCFGVGIAELALILSAPISSHLAFLPRMSKIAVAMHEVCLLKHPPWGMEIWPCTFLLSTDVCEPTYAVAKARQGGTEIFLYSHLLSITSHVFHPSTQQVKLQYSQFKIFWTRYLFCRITE